jgi:hypothetical protein
VGAQGNARASTCLERRLETRKGIFLSLNLDLPVCFPDWQIRFKEEEHARLGLCYTKRQNGTGICALDKFSASG